MNYRRGLQRLYAVLTVAWMTVVFFTAFGKVFGRLHLGQIQGIAQMLTVFASALGQKLVPWCNQRYDSYMPFFTASACVVAALGAWMLVLRMPAPETIQQAG